MDSSWRRSADEAGQPIQGHWHIVSHAGDSRQSHGKTQWSCDVTLPGMLHARMVRPATLGSTLISVGEVDKKRFPTARGGKEGQPGCGRFSE